MSVGKELSPEAQKQLPKSEPRSDLHIGRKEMGFCPLGKIPFYRAAITSETGQPGLKLLSILTAEHFLGAKEPGPFED